ncbi:hypothetical protein, partial [Pantoea ananatis]
MSVSMVGSEYRHRYQSGNGKKGSGAYNGSAIPSKTPTVNCGFQQSLSIDKKKKPPANADGSRVLQIGVNRQQKAVNHSHSIV